MKRAIVWLLVLVLLVQALPAGALARTASMTETELTAAVSLAGYMENAPGYIPGMKASRDMTGKQLIGYLESLLANQVHTLENYYEDAENSFTRTDRENGADGEERTHRLFRETEGIRMKLEYWHSRLNSQTTVIIRDAELLAKPLTDYEVRLYTHRIRDAVEEIRGIRSEMADSIPDCEARLEQQIRDLAQAGGHGSGGQENPASRTQNARNAVIKDTAVSVSSLFPTRQTLLGSPAAAGSDREEARLTVIDDDQNCVKVVDASGNGIAGADIHITDIRSTSDPITLDLKTDDYGDVIFSNTGFRFKNDKLRFSMRVSADGYRTAVYDSAEVKKGETFRTALAKDTGEPYIAGCSFDGNECLYTEYEAIYSPANDLACTMRVTVVNPSDRSCVVQLMYRDANGKQYFHTMGIDTGDGETYATGIAAGSTAVLTTKTEWRRKLKPGGAKFTLDIDGESKTEDKSLDLLLVIQNQAAVETDFAEGSPKLVTGQYFRTAAQLKVAKAKVEQPVVAVNLLSSFFGNSLNILNFNFPMKNSGPWFKNASVGFDLPFQDLIPRISVALDGSFSIIVGKDFGDFTDKNGPLYNWKSTDSAEIAECLNETDAKSPFMRNIANGINEYVTATEKGGLKLGTVKGSVGFFAGLAGHTRYDQKTGKWASYDLSGLAGITFSLSADFSYTFVAGVVPIFLGLNFTATGAVAGSIGGTVTTNSSQVLTEDVLKNCGLQPSITGMTLYGQLMLTQYAGIGIRGIVSFSINGYGYINILFELMDSTHYRHLKIWAGFGIYGMVQLLWAHFKFSVIDSPELIIYEHQWSSSAASGSLFSRLISSAEAEDDPEPSPPLAAVDYPDLVPDSTEIFDSVAMNDTDLQILDIGGVPFVFYIAQAPSDGSGRPRVYWTNTETGASGNFEEVLKDAADKKSRYTISSILDPTTYIEEMLFKRDEPVYAEENAGLYKSSDLAFQAVKVVNSGSDAFTAVYPDLCALTVLSADVESTGDDDFRLNGTPRLYTIGFIPDGDGGLTCELPSIHDSEPGILPKPDYPFWPIQQQIIKSTQLTWRMLYSVPLEGDAEELKNLILSGLSGTVTFFDTWLEHDQDYTNLHDYSIELNAAIGDNVAAISWEVPNFHRSLSGANLYDTYQYRHYGNKTSVTQTLGMDIQASVTKSAGFALAYYSVEDAGDGKYQLWYNAPRYPTMITEETEIPRYRVLPGEKYDLVFYLSGVTMEDGNEKHRMHMAKIQHPGSELPTYLFADLDIEVPGAAFMIAEVGSTIYVYWLESASDSQNQKKTVFRLRGVAFDPDSCIASDDFVLAQFSAPSDQGLRRLLLTGNNTGYFVMGKTQEGNTGAFSETVTGSVYSFPFSMTPSLKVDVVSLDSDVVAVGENDTVILRLTNDGNVAITAFTLEERAVKVSGSSRAADAGDLVETVQIDTAHPENNHLHLERDDPALDITGKEAGWRVPLAMDNVTQDYWEIKQTIRTFTSEESYKDEEKTVSLQASEILPGQVAGFKVLLKTPSSWKGTTHVLTMGLASCSAEVNHLKSLATLNGLAVDRADGREAQTVTYTRGNDGRLYREADGLLRLSGGMELFASSMEAPQSTILNHRLYNLVVGRRVYVMPDGEKRLSMVITNDAADWREIRLTCEVYLDGSDTPVYMDLPYDSGSTSHARTQTIDMPLSALSAGQKASHARVTVRGIGIEETTMLDNTFEVELDETDPLRFIVHPQSCTVEEGGSVLLTAEAAGGTAPYQYRWQVYMGESLGWKDLEGSEGGSLALENVHAGMEGWRYRCAATDQELNTVYSNEAVLTVQKKLPSTGDPADPLLWALAAAAGLAGLWLQACRRRRRTP